MQQGARGRRRLVLKMVSGRAGGRAGSRTRLVCEPRALGPIEINGAALAGLVEVVHLCLAELAAEGGSVSALVQDRFSSRWPVISLRPEGAVTPRWIEAGVSGGQADVGAGEGE